MASDEGPGCGKEEGPPVSKRPGQFRLQVKSPGLENGQSRRFAPGNVSRVERLTPERKGCQEFLAPNKGRNAKSKRVTPVGPRKLYRGVKKGEDVPKGDPAPDEPGKSFWGTPGFFLAPKGDAPKDPRKGPNFGGPVCGDLGQPFGPERDLLPEMRPLNRSGKDLTG